MISMPVCYVDRLEVLSAILNPQPQSYPCCQVAGTSTRTASRLPKISVDEVGCQYVSLVLGAGSFVGTGTPGVMNTSHPSKLPVTTP